MDATVALFLFNRPDTTQRVFREIARAKPSRLLVVADGPRADRPGEAELCARTRAIIEAVDWDCTVRTNFSDVNLGCRQRVSSGLDWVFSIAEEAIILEDDCLPHPDFFPFCSALLDRYRRDERVMAISGSNFHKHRRWGDASYHFSRYVDVWGWATWRRAWRHYDVTMRDFPVFAEQWQASHPSSSEQTLKLLELLRATYDGLIDTWDYQWLFAVWRRSGLVAVSNTNLVSNIGFDNRATHTRDRYYPYAALPTFSLGTLRHPSRVEPNPTADFLYLQMRTKKRFSHRLRGYVQRRFARLRERVAGR